MNKSLSKVESAREEVSNLPQKAPSLLARMAAKYAVDADKMLATLKATCFKGNVSNEQLMALLIVADQFGLNPWTKEIYAFPDKNNGIVPVVGVDGWIRIVNSNHDFESMTFADGPLNDEKIPEWIECTIHLRNRTTTMVIKEWFEECYRDTGPWKSHPRRMLRHKAMVQCARLALGFVGIYDPDEATRIANAMDITPAVIGKPKTSAPKARLKQESPPADDEVQPISADQVTVITDKLREEGVEPSRFLDHVGLGSIEDIDARGVASALEAIDELSRAGA